MDISKLLKIAPILNNNKDKIEINELMKRGVIPRHPTSIIFNGRSGSGKTILLSNLLVKPIFYGDYFDDIYLFAASPDELFEELNVKKNHIFKNVKKWDESLNKITSKQSSDIKAKGIHKSRKVLVIFEDIINHKSWMRRSPFFTKLFIANRHYNISCWVTSQSWTSVPRAIRINANNIYYFKGTEGETDLLAEEYAPSVLTKKEFKSLINYACADDYAFLTIMNKKKESERFRKNLDKILVL